MTVLCEISTSQSQENVHANQSSVIESLPVSPISVEDSKPAQKEIDIFLVPNNLIPPGVENDDSEDEDNKLPNLDHQDDPAIPRPPPEPPDVEKCFEPEAGTDISKITRKQSKTGKHGHEKRKSTREAKDSKPKPEKVKLQCDNITDYEDNDQEYGRPPDLPNFSATNEFASVCEQGKGTIDVNTAQELEEVQPDVQSSFLLRTIPSSISNEVKIYAVGTYSHSLAKQWDAILVMIRSCYGDWMLLVEELDVGDLEHSLEHAISSLYQEKMLLAMKYEVGSNLNDEENDFMLDNSFGEETMEELTAVD
ncbi:hypothetical protein Tco_0414244 [Tanacetum coccineum]